MANRRAADRRRRLGLPPVEPPSIGVIVLILAGGILAAVLTILAASWFEGP